MTDYTAPKTYTAGEMMTSDILNTHLRDNMKALKDPPTDLVTLSANVGMPVSGDWQNVAGMSVTITTFGGDLMFTITATIVNGTTEQTPGGATYTYFDIYNATDDERLGGDDGLQIVYNPNSVSIPESFSLIFWKLGLPAGTYTFNLQWKRGSEEVTMLGTDVHSQFSVREVS